MTTEGKRYYNVQVSHQIAFFIEGKMGSLADTLNILGSNNINIYALTLVGGADHCFVRLVVDNTEKAIEVLKEAGFFTSTKDVLILNIPNEPGTLGKAIRILEQEGINIDYLYCAGIITEKISESLVVIKIDDVKKAASLLSNLQ